MNKKTDRIRSYIVILLMLVISVAALIGSIQIYQKRPGMADAGIYPLLMSGLMVVSIVFALLEVRGLAKKETETEKDAEHSGENAFVAALKAEFPQKTVFLGACILGYGVLFHFVGFYISTAIFLLVTMTGLYRGKKMKLTVGVTVITLVCVYLIIERIFNIPLP